MRFLTDQKLQFFLENMPVFNRMYQINQPFPHILIDDVFDFNLLGSVAEVFPGPDSTFWWKYDNVLEKKLAKDDLSDAPFNIRLFVQELMEKRFVNFLEKLTGIEGLIVDHRLNGGGLHQILPGGKLDVHADYNFHPVTGLDRRLNVLVYLNRKWDLRWGGALELWDKDMTKCEIKIPPVFNRMVIFSTTDQSLHGHPEPLKCPDGETRKSIALYYYTNGRPEAERSAPHSTLYKKRPQDPFDPATEELRAQRAKGRIHA